MYIVAIGWMFVVVCMAAAEAASSSVLGALVTLLVYGLLPLGLFLWLIGTPQRHRDRRGERRVVTGASFKPRSSARPEDPD